MSLWRELNGEKFFQNISKNIHRVIEDQAGSALRELVSNRDEASLLEDICDEQKPIAQTFNSRGKLHHLLYTPMRYAPLKGGGRFHQTFETSIFYGAYNVETALAERAFIAFKVNDDAGMRIERRTTFFAFDIPIETEKCVYLCRAPFDDYLDDISDPSSYKTSQPLGTDMRDAGATAFVYMSARREALSEAQPQTLNVGIINPDAFAKNTVDIGRYWQTYITPTTIEFTRTTSRISAKEELVFNLDDFLIDGKMPNP